MFKFYCSDCGAATLYALTPPKFCSNCGLNPNTNLRVAAKPQPEPKIIPRRRLVERYEDEIDEDEEYSGEVPVYKASITFDIEPRGRGIKFSELQNIKPVGFEARGINPSIANQNDSEFLNTFNNSSKAKSEISVD